MSGAIYSGRYETIRLLGRGSMGKVYLARQFDDPSRPVVIKQMLEENFRDPRSRQLFIQEIHMMACLDHPYIVRMFDAAIDERHGPFLVMEYIPGITLEEVIKKQNIFTPTQAALYVAPLCRALQFAHERGIVHRDLKPANLMVTNYCTEEESLKVMDFGLAALNCKPHIPLVALTGVGESYAVGTPAYICPEMVRGDEVDGRGDIYALGVMLFEMLTGKHPFGNLGVYEMLEAHTKTPPPRFAKLDLPYQIDPGFEELVRACLAKFPNERPQTAKDLAVEYGRLLDFDIWTESEPIGFVEPPIDEPRRLMTEARKMQQPPTKRDPHTVIMQLQAWMPERIAAVKLRGFVEDRQFGGRVLESEPGIIRVRFDEAPPNPPAATNGLMGLFNRWTKGSKAAAPEPIRDAIELEIQLDRPDAGKNDLTLTIVFRPLPETTLRDPREWRDRCMKIYDNLRCYVIAQR